MSDKGYAEATPEGLAKSAKLALEAWGRSRGHGPDRASPAREPGDHLCSQLSAPAQRG